MRFSAFGRGAFLGVMTGVGSRPVLLAINAVSVPLLIRGGGRDVFSSWLVLAAAGDWATNLRGGAAESQLRPATVAHELGDRGRSLRHLAVGQRAASLSAFLVLAIGGIAAISSDSLWGYTGLDPVHGALAVALATLLLALTVLLSVSPLVSAAQNQTSVNHLVRTLAGLLVLAAMASALVMRPVWGLPTLVAIGLAPPLVSNAVLWIVSKSRGGPSLLSLYRIEVSGQEIREAFRDGLPYLTFATAQSATATTAAIVLAPRLSPGELIGFVLSLRLMLMGSTVLWSGIRPLWPAIAAQSATGHVAATRSGFRRILYLSLFFAAILAGVGVWLGRDLVAYWSQSEGETTFALLLVLGMLAVVKTWNNCYFVLRSGTGSRASDSWLWLLETVGVIASVIVGAKFFGALGAAWGLLIGTTVTSGVLLPLVTREALKSNETRLEDMVVT